MEEGYEIFVIPTGAQRSGGTCVLYQSKETRVPHPSRVGSTAGDFCLLGDYAKGGLKSFCHPWSPWQPAATEGPRVSPTKPKGEFSRENSPRADRISKIWRSARDHNLALPALLRIREQYPHIPCFRTCMSYELFSPCCLQSPEVSSLPIL